MAWVSRFIISLAFMSSGLWAPSAWAQSRDVIVEAVPQLEDIYQVSAKDTHSGLPVPRFVSLKYNRINGRLGPSLKHPILWEYKRKGLPVIVVAEMDVWRKIRDIDGDESWVRGSALSSRPTVLTLNAVELRTKPADTARIKAVADKNVILEIEKCVDNEWCKVQAGDRLSGWIRREQIWGAE